MNTTSRRSFERLFYFLISLVLLVNVARAQSPSLTTITDTIYRADGAPAAGQLVISWPAFTTAANNAVAAGEKTLVLGANGALSTQLAPNEGATPTGSYYKVVYKLSDGTTATEYWTVPVATPTTVGLIRATVVPAQVAAQLVTRQYVDNVLGAADIVHKAGAETITGVKAFSAPPTVPTPTAGTQAANKAYVDAQVGGAAGTDVMHLSGAETVTGVKTFTVAPIVPTPAASGEPANKSYVDTQLGVIAPNGNRIGAIRQAHLFAGADAGAKISACIADLPAAGGTCDARGLEGTQAITTSIVVDRPTVLVLGGAIFQLSAAGEFAVTSSLRVLGTMQNTNNLSAGTILQMNKAGAIFRFPTGASSKVEQFELADLQVQGGGGSWDNYVVDVPSNAPGSFDGNQARWHFHDLWISNTGSSASTKAALNFGDSIYWISVERTIFMNNLGGDINTGYADDLNITHNFFWQLSTFNPHIRIVGGTSSFITQNEFENGMNSPQPDILLRTETSIQRGFIHILQNKFGAESEGGRAYKVRAYSSAFPSTLISTVWFQQNEVFGLSSASPIAAAIQLDNPTPRWIIKDNNFYNVSTVVNDNVGLVDADVSGSILRDNLITPPVSGTKLFANGGRSFSVADQSIGTADRPFSNVLKMTESPELRNRLAYSEALDNPAWTKSAAVTVTTAQSDPYGTTRAIRLNNDNTSTFANLRAPLDVTGLGNRVVLRFWAKAGTLDRLDIALYDTFGVAIPSGGVSQLKLSSVWQEYKLTFAIVSPAHTHDLYLYVGDRTITNSGNLFVFGVQVADYDSDYVKTAGASFVDTNLGSRYERKAEFARDIYVAGSSTNPTTNKFQITGASTGGIRSVTLADGNSVSVIPDSGAANNFLTGITSAGVITKAQPTFASLSGNVAISQLNGGSGASTTTFWRGDGTWATPATGSAGLPDPASEEWSHESWCGGIGTSGQIGTLGWRTAAFGTGSPGLDSFGTTAGVGGGCALQFRQATAASGAGLIVYLGGVDGTAQSLFNASPWWVQSSINLESTTSETVRFGKSSTISAETGTDGAFIRFIGGTDTQFICEVIKGGATAIATIAVTPAANTWYKARVERDASGNIICTVNSTTATVTAANAPTSAAVFDIFLVKSLAASASRLRSRYYEQHWTGLTR